MAFKKKCYFFLTNSVFLWHFLIIFLKKLKFHQNIIWSSSNLLILQAICSFVSMNPILSIWDISFVNFLIENHSETDFFEKNECILSWEPVCKKLKISMVFHLGNQVKAFFDRFYDAWSDKSRCITDFRRFLWFLPLGKTRGIVIIMSVVVVCRHFLVSSITQVNLIRSWWNVTGLFLGG